eukprot:TRINITY_DN50084_c0_g1_i1.p1 TRINITY_DN50084_c0_g1~~TRINITY_DN50084_c0_g1_i1.p1  ORF type:complete len:559 (+),score=107.37 TRINITY_DN50084_c0_g1_i1:200-1876(+)
MVSMANRRTINAVLASGNQGAGKSSLINNTLAASSRVTPLASDTTLGTHEVTSEKKKSHFLFDTPRRSDSTSAAVNVGKVVKALGLLHQHVITKITKSTDATGGDVLHRAVKKKKHVNFHSLCISQRDYQNVLPQCRSFTTAGTPLSFADGKAERPSSLTDGREARPLCFADRKSKVLAVKGEEVPVGDDFWEYIADAQSVEDAAKYQNNTENYIGTVKYPVGLIGPLQVNGEFAKRPYFVPFATHEGALVASYSRGAKAIHAAGGCTVRIKSRCMLRAPVFLFKNVEEATDFYRFAIKNQDELSAYLCKTIDPHCEVTSIRVIQTDRKVHISIGIDSDDAAGQNMVTYAGEVAMKVMKKWYKKDIPEVYIEGGFNAGKRVSVLHTLLGKGHSVVVDCVIPKEICKEILHTTPYRLQRFQKMHHRSNEFMGGISCTAHVANGLAAFYIANGQDPACTAESSAAVTHFDLVHGDNDESVKFEDCDLYASMTLNTIIVATVGGGTNLPSFKASRGITGVKSANELAELCAAVCLSGELSFYAAMESGEFAAAHWNMTHKY